MNIRTKHLPAEERRAATVEAVIELAAGHDPGEITTTAIAQHMGVTQGALFKHFPTKDAILEAVMTWVADRLLNRVDRAAQAAATSAAALEAMFLAHTGFVAEHPGVPRMMFGETLPEMTNRALPGSRSAKTRRAGKMEGSSCTSSMTAIPSKLPRMVSAFSCNAWSWKLFSRSK